MVRFKKPAVSVRRRHVPGPLEIPKARRIPGLRDDLPDYAIESGTIAFGGEIEPRETARLERKEARIHREITSERAANGGALTPAERARIDRQQNRVSRQIYRQKHDAQRR